MDNNSSSLLDSEQRVINQLNQLNQDMSKTLHQSSCLSLNSKGQTNQDGDSGKDSIFNMTYKQIINQVLSSLPENKGSKTDIINSIQFSYGITLEKQT